MSDDGRPTFWGWVGAFWGLAGVLFLLGFAVVRLTPLAVESLRMPLSTLQWAFLVVWVFFMVFAEGYRGFQKAFSPRVAARARHLRDHPTLVRVLFAPLFCMAYFAAPRRRRIASYALTVGIILLVVIVQQLEQPWRGLVDVGVVLGLGWGVAAIVVFAARALGGRGIAHPHEVI